MLILANKLGRYNLELIQQKMMKITSGRKFLKIFIKAIILQKSLPNTFYNLWCFYYFVLNLKNLDVKTPFFSKIKNIKTYHLFLNQKILNWLLMNNAALPLLFYTTYCRQKAYFSLPT